MATKEEIPPTELDMLISLEDELYARVVKFLYRFSEDYTDSANITLGKLTNRVGGQLRHSQEFANELEASGSPANEAIRRIIESEVRYLLIDSPNSLATDQEFRKQVLSCIQLELRDLVNRDSAYYNYRD